jgi:hypothetical protein
VAGGIPGRQPLRHGATGRQVRAATAGRLAGQVQEATMNHFLNYALDRAQERTTWLGAVLLLSSLGIAVSPELQAAIVEVGLAASGLALMVVTERRAVKGRVGPDAPAKE